MKSFLADALYGLVIGALMMLPGISGGTLAVLLGVYDKLIHAVASFGKAPKKHAAVLLAFALGGTAGALIVSKLLLNLLESYETPLMYLFFGAIIGSFPALYRRASNGRPCFRDVIYLGAGASAVALMSFLPVDTLVLNTDGAEQLIALFIAGVLLAIPFVLPGISASYMLLFFGIYETTLEALHTLNFAVLVPLAAGAGAGVLLTAKILEKCIAVHPRPTYLIISGFVLGSIYNLFPGLPSGGELGVCILTFFLGLSCIFLLGEKTR